MTRAEAIAAIQDAKAEVRRRSCWLVTVAVVSSVAFLAGAVWPDTTTAAGLFVGAAVGYLVTAVASRWRNEASDRLARVRLEAARL